jgi:hypothetical protein
MRCCAIIAAAVLSGCSAGAQAACTYDFYIYSPGAGDDIYAVAGEGRTAAVSVRRCGEASLMQDAAAAVAQIEARRPHTSVVTVAGPGSRTQLGPCADDRGDEGGESLVIVERASARQVERIIRTLDAAPPSVRAQMIETLELRQCRR